MDRQRIAQVAVGVNGVFALPLGLQAAFTPRSFFDDFPLGRGWVAMVGGSYDEHLVRDVGGLFLALAIASIWAWWRPQLVRPLAVAWLLQGLLHFTFHLRHLQHFEGFDKVAQTASLATIPAVAAIALWADATATPTSSIGDT